MFRKKTKKLYFMPHGQLDSLSAHKLIERIGVSLKKGYREVIVDGKRIYPLLPDGLDYIRKSVLYTFASYSPFSIKLIELCPKSLATIHLADYPYRDREFIFTMPPHTQVHSEGGAFIDCKQCNHYFYTDNSERYTCPSCGKG